MYLATTSQALITSVLCPNATSLSGDDTLPMNCITWYEAYAFCIWDGGRLPTDAEWGYAAAGGGATDGQRFYPWSMPPESMVIDSTYAVYYASAPAAVGSRSPKGDGKWRQADLLGNVGEWLVDYGGDHPRPCFDCSNKVFSEGRVLRGGWWSYPPIENPASRAEPFPLNRGDGFGARCARR
jgi:formylglycine-generating enzyme